MVALATALAATLICCASSLARLLFRATTYSFLPSMVFAGQLSGKKFWRLHRFVGENRTKSGENLEGDLIYEGLVNKGDLLIFHAWLPHETQNWGEFCLFVCLFVGM